LGNPVSSHLINKLPTPIIFGHRGASKYAPENTLASFMLSFKSGAPAIELDAMLSADQEVVVIHDHMVDRTTNGSGYINQMNLEQLKKLDAGIKFSHKFKGEKIPTLDEVLESISADLLVNIELKNYHSLDDSLVHRVCEIVKKHDKANSTFFSSFYSGNLFKVRKIFPDAPVALITMGGVLGKIESSPFLRWISPNFINPEYHLVDNERIVKEHFSHRRVNVWTVDNPDEIIRFFRAKVDGVITNDPALAIKLLSKGFI
jgi:glycerophosphoryl diester phosphodiesterase